MEDRKTRSAADVADQAQYTVEDLSRRGLLSGAGAAGAFAGIAGVLAFRGAEVAQAAGANDAILNVKDPPYGAKGDGVTDDTAALQQAIIDGVATGRTVFLPAGEYMVGSHLRMRDGLTMRGAGRFKTSLCRLPSWSGPLLNYEDKSEEFNEPGVFDQDLTLTDITFDGKKVTGGSSMLHSYNISRWHIARCRFMHSKGYGVGLQGRPYTGNGPQEDLYFLDCEFIDNHYETEGSGAIDVKSSRRLTMVNCLIVRDPTGYDIRSHFATLINCHARQCSSTGMLLRSTANFPGSLDWDGYFTVLGGSAEECGRGLVIGMGEGPEGFDDGNTHATIVGFSARNNTNGMGTTDVLAGTEDKLSLTVLGGEFNENISDGIRVFSPRELTIHGAICRDNGGDGIRAVDTKNASISGCQIQSNDGWGVNLEGSVEKADGVITAGNVISGNAKGNLLNSGPNSKVAGNTTSQSTTVASASMVVLPPLTETVIITGSTNITAIALSWNGRRVTMGFVNAVTVVNGGNLKLRGNLQATLNDTLTLVCQGGNWYEVSRSAN